MRILIGKVSPEVFKAEEKHKEKVYCTFDSQYANAAAEAAGCKNQIVFDANEDHDAFMAHSAFSKAKKKELIVKELVNGLYEKPYFAHIEADIDNEGAQDFYLSDCDSLTSAIIIDGGGILLPFKRDKERPISSAIFRCYQQMNSEPVTYADADGQQCTFKANLICDDKIEKRKLTNVLQLVPESDASQIIADELLDQRLQENRSNPSFQNIIATLQQQQFKIIEADLNTDFVVQGCAGSGKSQCMLHRLFYLRDELDEIGWEKVLLLTPTQLFREYSSDLINRYQLSDVYDCSISDLYRHLLESYDPRFKKRQYYFELSEEYLPDCYLQKIYQDEVIEDIDNEIESAIVKYIQAGCDALGIPLPVNITAEVAGYLAEELGKEIKRFDESENVLQQDPEYLQQRERYDKLQKNLISAQKTYDRLVRDMTEVQTKKTALENQIAEVENAKAEVSQLKEQQRTIAEKRDALYHLTENTANITTADFPVQYARSLFLFDQVSHNAVDKEYLNFAEEYFQAENTALQNLLGRKSPAKAVEEYTAKQEQLSLKSQEILTSIHELSDEIDASEIWLRTKREELEGIKSQKALQRSEMERARYFLSRLESTVFEQEVWNALAPLKKQCGIDTVRLERGSDGRQKEVKILYKSDLLFYLMVYTKLHSGKEVPRYDFICVDEGQDLHRADYDLLRSIYPKAVFNIFGDVEQVLHQACGIHNWQEETGIKTVYRLTKNYRNTAAIVEFCNQRFGSSMGSVGSVRRNEKPHVVADDEDMRRILAENNIVIIVKGKEQFELLSKKFSNLEYFDTNVGSSKTDKRACYSIFAAKGLEFPSVLVYANGMTKNQEVVACTRAMGKLYYYEQ